MAEKVKMNVYVDLDLDELVKSELSLSDYERIVDDLNIEFSVTSQQVQVELSIARFIKEAPGYQRTEILKQFSKEDIIKHLLEQYYDDKNTAVIANGYQTMYQDKLIKRAVKMIMDGKLDNEELDYYE